MKHKILLVDDDVDLINLYQPILQNAGFEVEVAYNAEEGIQKFSQFKPEAMLVDLAMEHFDSGFVLCKKIKSLPEGKNIPVVIMTAAAHETGIRFSTQTEEEKNWIKADDYLDKPISARDLLQYVTEKLFKNR
ncbi:MAG TPA: response regulator [bacterium]|nr:response regulator [bacterium]HNT66038.1 response regulator [bacterium]